MSNQPFNMHDKNSLLAALENIKQYLEKLPVAKPCNICIHYSSGFCKNWHTEVPEEARADGCEKFQFNPHSAPF